MTPQLNCGTVVLRLMSFWRTMDGAKACSQRTFGQLRVWGFIVSFITMRPIPYGI